MKEGEVIKIFYNEKYLEVKVIKIYKQHGFDNHGKTMATMIILNQGPSMWDNEITIPYTEINLVR